MAQGPLVCIVDDDAWVRSGIGDLVSSLGYSACTFESAEEFTQSGHIDEAACVITDLNMPGLSGLELQSRLRREGRNTPLIFLTAHADHAYCERALAQGALCFLLKPLDAQSLIECLAFATTPQTSL